MTRASLLRILDHVNGISEVEVRELEQLATAFPYCQTAHLLLAKAAHDRGSMLAGQRLRRAATYAADRELLRRLLEQPAPATAVVAETALAPAASEPKAAEQATDSAPDLFAVTAPVAVEIRGDAAELAAGTEATADAQMAEVALVAQKSDLKEVEEAPQPKLAATETGDAVVSPDSEAEPTAELAEPAVPALPAVSQQPAEDLQAAAPEETPALETLAGTGETQQRTAPALPLIMVDAEALPSAAEAAHADTTVLQSEPAAELTSSESSADESVAAEFVVPVEPVVAEVLTAPAAAVPYAVEEADPADDEAGDLLPAVAPPIRPPVERGISRFEFGLGAARLPEPSGYQLPGADEEYEETEAQPEELPARSNNVAPPITAPFRADADLGYALGAGSRLGYDLQLRTDGFALDLPLDAFFEPDALLLAHARAHQPRPKASSLDLINRFLKAQPRIKTPGGVPLPAAEQTDLSVRSTSTAPALASESLAKIMVRQGKTEKAIEIYERLMARQPEKKAYFAEQIQQLQQPPE